MYLPTATERRRSLFYRKEASQWQGQVSQTVGLLDQPYSYGNLELLLEFYFAAASTKAFASSRVTQEICILL